MSVRIRLHLNRRGEPQVCLVRESPPGASGSRRRPPGSSLTAYGSRSLTHDEAAEFTGPVEADETLIGGHPKNMSNA